MKGKEAGIFIRAMELKQTTRNNVFLN